MFDLNTLAVIKDHGSILENLKDGGITVTLSGIIIVFAMLVLLVAIIWAFGKIMTAVTGNGKPPKEKKAKKEAPAADSKASAGGASNVSEDEGVIAAISAAIMMMYEGTGKTPVIRSIRPAATGMRSAWAAAGIANNTRPF